MGRLVQADRLVEIPPSALESMGGRTEARVAGDPFTERLVKYIPAEVIGAYLSLENLLNLREVVTKAKVAPVAGATTEAVAQAQGVVAVHGPRIAGIVFLLGLICTPIYIWQQGRSSGSPWATHAFVATMAFAVWAYAMGGSFFLQNFGNLTQLYDSQIAAAGLVAFTLVSGAVKPGSTID